MEERTGEAFVFDERLTVVGSKLLPGEAAPDFLLDYLDLIEMTIQSARLKDSTGMVRLLNVVNSLEKPVCDRVTLRWEKHRAELPNGICLYTVSMDPPLAQARWQAAKRLILFSEGVIAFAITIAAISIKIPRDPALLVAQRGSRVVAYIVYIVSFLIVAASWNEHHRLFHYIKRNDMMLVLLNFAYLAAIVLIPIGIFFIEVVDPNNLPILLKAVSLFLGSMLGASLALLLTWLYASRRHRLLEAQMTPRLITYMTMRLLFSPALMLVLLVTVVFPPVGLVGLLALGAALLYRHWYRRGLDIAAGSHDVGRILLFSDAVIGIAITIIAAQIEFPAFAGSTAGEEVQTAIASERQPDRGCREEGNTQNGFLMKGKNCEKAVLNRTVCRRHINSCSVVRHELHRKPVRDPVLEKIRLTAF